METSGKLNTASSHKESAKLKLGERVGMIAMLSVTIGEQLLITEVVSGVKV
jgi:hypothetical protein